MKDKAGREVNEGDFCLFSTADNNLAYGMICGKSFISVRGCLEYVSAFYKLPDELNDFEKKRKEIIQKQYDKYYKEKEAKKKFKGIGAKELEVGQAYATIGRDVFIYFGHGTVTAKYGNDKPEGKTGFIYLRAGGCSFEDAINFKVYHQYATKYILADMSFKAHIPEVTVSKSRKKFVAKIDYKSPVITKQFEYDYRDEYNFEDTWVRQRASRSHDELYTFKLD